MSFNLQAACDQASQDRRELVLSPGMYSIYDTLRVKCPIRTEGEVKVIWRGGDEGKWMVALEDPDQHFSVNLSGFILCGRDKAKGLLIDNVHDIVIEDIHIFETVGGGIRIKDAWCLIARNLSCSYGEGPGFEASVFNSSVLERWSSTHMYGNSPIVTVSGVAKLDQLAIARCESGDSPVVLLEHFNGGELNSLHCERVGGTEVLHVTETEGADIKHLTLGNRDVPVGVLVTESQDVLVDDVRGWGLSDAIVRIDYESHMAKCRATRVRERHYINRPSARHVVDYAGLKRYPSGS